MSKTHFIQDNISFNLIDFMKLFKNYEPLFCESRSSYVIKNDNGFKIEKLLIT